MTHRPRRSAVLALLLSPLLVAMTALSVLAAAPAQARPAASTLASRVQTALRGSTAAHVDYRVHVSGVGTISHNGTRASAPASNEKLFTVITLLELVGPEFRYATPISGTAAVAAGGILHGALVLRGSGDPTLTKGTLLALAKHLHAKGLRKVTDGLIVDDTRYSHTTRAPGWKHDFVPDETGTVDAFSVDDNQWHGGAAFNADPSAANAALWRHELRRAHIKIDGPTRIAPAPASLRRLLTHRSPDLAAIIDDTLTNSVNFNAEMMLREAGAQRSGFGSRTTGIAAVRATARKLHLPLGTAHDGSGLSYADRESPATIVRWLTALRSLPAPIFNTVYFALPLSCETGTLIGRMCDPALRGIVRAKTGTLDHNSALSGYTTTASGRAVTFSFLLSGFKDKNFNRVMARVNAAIGVIVRTG